VSAARKDERHLRGDVPEHDIADTLFTELALRGTASRQTWVAGVAFERSTLDPKDEPRFSFLRMGMESMSSAERSLLARRGRRLEYFTIAWNSLEGLVAIGAGLFAGSISLVGFGVDSFIEVTSGAALLWRMSGDDDARREHREAITLRIVGVCFLALAAYVGYEAVRDLVSGSLPRPSRVGIAVAAVSLVAMPLLSRAKRHVASALASGAMHADARQTDFCMYLSAILLAGLALNLVVGWW
jgi:divalent metal cation (Fe/Co/Zn/Cd) transporter